MGATSEDRCGREVGHERREPSQNECAAEFEEMPGLVLTMPQASRLFGLGAPRIHQGVMDRLVGDAFRTLIRPDGSVTRASRR